jgi:hypothetical protein
VEFGPGDTGGVIRTAQVTGLFDLWPSSLPCRQVQEGPPQAHRRSVRGQRILAQHRPARSRFIRGRSLHSAGHAQARKARPAARRGSANEAPRRHATQLRPVQGATPISAGFSRLPAASLRHAGAHNVGPPVIFRAPGGLFTEDGRPSKSGASGSVNRLLGPDSVRYMSVTTAMQGPTAAHDDTQRDNIKAAREFGYAQAMGGFRRWWQVLGSNQRRLSRRFYRPLPLATRATCLAPPRSTAK